MFLVLLLLYPANADLQATSSACDAWVSLSSFCSEARVDRLKQAVVQGRDGEAACQLTILQSVANQVLDDMEDKEVVPNK